MPNIFPRASNCLPPKLLVVAGLAGLLAVAGVWYYFTPKYGRTGYRPEQPVSFSHALHAGQLGLDCRHCHSFVETAAHSNVPDTQACMRCHSQVQKDSPLLAAVRASWENATALPWTQIHKTPDFVYYNHAAHVNRGISCVSCHGPVHRMEVVFHHQPQSMSWCLDCHRQPANQLRPREEVFNLDWQPAAGTTQQEIGRQLARAWNINPSANCATCHR